ncbi:MAG TPA: esterase-like activity of phytase family protein [Solirubrobacterales bacterium]|nr:esterase-like activity of phytase family protein [Solirubrobacterales bacterium]
MRRKRTLALALAICALGAALAAAVASAHHSPQYQYHHHPSPPPHHPGTLAANADSYSSGKEATIAVEGPQGVLANDQGDEPNIVANTEPEHGSLELEPDGGFTYTPELGFSGTDSFTYTIDDAVHAYKTDLPSIGNYGGVQLTGAGFGSSLYPVPGHPNEFFGLEDRGPNVESSTGTAVEPKPDYDPSIGRFVFEEGEAELVERIPLRDSTGHPFSGLVNSNNPTGETVENLKGTVLSHDPDGYDPEGLVALPDGTFWVSDEYGPFITHFTAQGREIQRLSPFKEPGNPDSLAVLPAELAKRVPNRGLEGLTITPDGKTLVAMMQSSLQQTDLEGANAKKDTPTRIVTYSLQTHAVHEYLFLLDEPATTGVANSEITALSNSTFLIDERDSGFPSATGYKKLWEVNLEGATDVGPSAKVTGATYKAEEGGLLIGGKTIEKTLWGLKTAEAKATLEADHVKPVSATLFLDIDQLLTSLNPTDAFFDHDKVEGVAALEGGKRIVISNDSDFGISGVIGTTGPKNAAGEYTEAPWKLVPKIQPATGKQDDGEFLEINMAELPPKTSTATVTLHVTEAH